MPIASKFWPAIQKINKNTLIYKYFVYAINSVLQGYINYFFRTPLFPNYLILFFRPNNWNVIFLTKILWLQKIT